MNTSHNGNLAVDLSQAIAGIAHAWTRREECVQPMNHGDGEQAGQSELPLLTLLYVEARERGVDHVQALEALTNAYPEYREELVDFAVQYCITDDFDWERIEQAIEAHPAWNAQPGQEPGTAPLPRARKTKALTMGSPRKEENHIL